MASNIVTQNPDITASELRTVFAGAGEFGQSDVPLSRYLRPPGGTIVPDLPTNVKVKNFPLDVKYSDYVGSRFWYLAIAFTASTGETESRYHNKNDGSMVLVIRGTSSSFAVKYRTGKQEIVQQVKSGEAFSVYPIDGDTGTYIEITDEEAAQNPPAGVTVLPPVYLIKVNCGYGTNAGNRGLRYKNIQYNVVYNSYSTSTFLYLPWYEGLNSDVNFINNLSVNPGKILWSKDNPTRTFTVPDEDRVLFLNATEQQKLLFRTKYIEFVPKPAVAESVVEYCVNPPVITSTSNFNGFPKVPYFNYNGSEKHSLPGTDNVPDKGVTWRTVPTQQKSPPLELKEGRNLIWIRVRSADDKTPGTYTLAPCTVYVLKILRVKDKNLNNFSELLLDTADANGDVFDK